MWRRRYTDATRGPEWAAVRRGGGMEPEIDFAPLLLVSALAFLIPIVTHRLSGGKVPSVVGEIAAGIVFGQTVIGVIDANVWLEFLSLFGFAYLMFLAGLEVDTALLARPLGPRWYDPRVALRHPMVSGVLLLLLALVVSALGVALIKSWGLVEDFWLLFFVFSATAVGVIAPVLKDRAELGGFNQVILVAGFLIEFTAIVAIGIIAAIDRQGLGVEALLLLTLPAAFLVLLLGARRGRTQLPSVVRLIDELAHTSAQLKIRGALALLVIFVVLSQVVGTELVLGSFFAGLALTILSPKQGSSMRIKLDALGYGFFIPIFFITVGATLDFDALFETADAALLIPAFIIIAIVGKMAPALLVLSPAYGVRRALAGGALFSANLSIILAAVTVAEDTGQFSEATSAALLVVALVSTAAAPWSFNALLPKRAPRPVGRAIVVGAGRAGGELAPRLARSGLQVTVIDRDAAALADLATEGFETVVGDAREASVIEAARADSAEVVVIDVKDPEMAYGVARSLRGRARDLRIVTWVMDHDPRLDALDVEMHTFGSATAVALEGAVLHPGLFSVLGSGADSGLEEVLVRNALVLDVPLRELPLHGGVRAVLVMRDGEVIIPEGDTTLALLDQVTLGGEPTAVREAFHFLGRHHLEDHD